MPVAIVTGASRGLGYALAHSLAADGWDLVVDARDAGALRAATAALSSGTIRAVPGDVADAAHRAALVAAATELGGIDLLVNNASVLGPSPQPRLADYPLDVLAHVYAVNTLAPVALAQLALPDLRERRGTIVNITSDAAVEPYEGWGGYGSSKAALEQLGNVLGAEEPFVHVYTFDPGDMRTQMHQDAFPGEDISDRPEPETVVPALRRLLFDKPESGRYRASDFDTAIASASGLTS
ncbi:MAG TPA: SDR family oxidoreductase [Acidimicrobiia bacterium]|nr:SDR family oxidoreductase [Acidimicrobiia bacterium]